jgi:hypothetical protein
VGFKTVKGNLCGVMGSVISFFHHEKKNACKVIDAIQDSFNGNPFIADPVV